MSNAGLVVALALLPALAVVAGGATEDLYGVTDLDERDLRPGPNRVVYGLIGDSFVVASSADLAREVESMPTEPAPEAATRLQIDVIELLRRATVDPGEDAELLWARP